MTVDLDRLRNDLSVWADVQILELNGPTPPGEERIASAAMTIIESPTVWWCDVYDEGSFEGCHEGPDQTCRNVALVPVKGANE